MGPQTISENPNSKVFNVCPHRWTKNVNLNAFRGSRWRRKWQPTLVSLSAEYLMRNAGLEETQAGIKIAGRNISNLRYADGTTLMAESEKELKSLMMKVKEESGKVGLNSTFRK